MKAPNIIAEGMAPKHSVPFQIPYKQFWNYSNRKKQPHIKLITLIISCIRAANDWNFFETIDYINSGRMFVITVHWLMRSCDATRSAKSILNVYASIKCPFPCLAQKQNTVEPGLWPSDLPKMRRENRKSIYINWLHINMCLKIFVCA